MQKKVVIACQVFYREVLDLAEAGEGIDVEFLPQGLHNLPDEEDMKDEIQAKINELEAEDYDFIILGYGYCSGGIEGLKSNQAKLVVPLTDDCIPMLLDKVGTDFCRESTYYLSRGWIDCGGDPYKQYLFLTDQEDKWKERFIEYEKKNERAFVEWYNHPEYRSNQKYEEKMAHYISYQCLKGYDSITLIDSGNLKQIHFDYAEEVYNFYNEILTEYEDRTIDYQEISGSHDFLGALVNVNTETEIKNNNELAIFPPGTQVEIENKLVKSLH